MHIEIEIDKNRNRHIENWNWNWQIIDEGNLDEKSLNSDVWEAFIWKRVVSASPLQRECRAIVDLIYPSSKPHFERRWEF